MKRYFFRVKSGAKEFCAGLDDSGKPYFSGDLPPEKALYMLSNSPRPWWVLLPKFKTYHKAYITIIAALIAAFVFSGFYIIELERELDECQYALTKHNQWWGR